MVSRALEGHSRMDLTPPGLAPGPAILSIPECREHSGRAPMSLPWVSNARWQTRLGSELVTRRVFSARQRPTDHRSERGSDAARSEAYRPGPVHRVTTPL